VTGITADVALIISTEYSIIFWCHFNRLGAEWVDYCQGFGSSDKTIESTKSDDFSLEVNNNLSQISSSLPFAFNTTVNELRVSDHSSCHQNDNKHKSEDLNPDSTQSETPKPSDDRIVSQLTGN
jgi:hypothetical protein